MARQSRLILATDRTSAKLLDMKTAEFRALVDQGALPGPVSIGGHLRWRYSDLEAIASGDALEEEFTP